MRVKQFLIDMKEIDCSYTDDIVNAQIKKISWLIDNITL
jgi:hypothetical protein